MADLHTELDGRLVWVTGASSGIGEALTHALAGRGARVVLSARREERLESVRQSLPEPGLHLVLPLDMAEPESFPEAVRRVLDFGETIDLLVHNAGISQRALAVDTDLAVDRRLLEVNFLGPVALTKAALPPMLEAGGGRLVVVSSLVGKIGTPLRSTISLAWCEVPSKLLKNGHVTGVRNFSPSKLRPSGKNSAWRR